MTKCIFILSQYHSTFGKMQKVWNNIFLKMYSILIMLHIVNMYDIKIQCNFVCFLWLCFYTFNRITYLDYVDFYLYITKICNYTKLLTCVYTIYHILSISATIHLFLHIKVITWCHFFLAWSTLPNFNLKLWSQWIMKMYCFYFSFEE